jgi:hypothetical protein
MLKHTHLDRQALYAHLNNGRSQLHTNAFARIFNYIITILSNLYQGSLLAAIPCACRRPLETVLVYATVLVPVVSVVIWELSFVSYASFKDINCFSKIVVNLCI